MADKKRLILYSLIFLFSMLAQAQHTPSSPVDIWRAVNEGWGGPYAELMPHLDHNKNYIVWSIIAPEKPLDLRKPDFFKRIISSNSSKKSFSISHNLIAWNCKLPDGKRYVGATGHSGEVSGQSTKLVKAGYGLTSFLSKFTDGWLSGGFHTADIFSERSAKEEIYSLVVEVPAQDCANMLGFLRKFIYHPNQPYRNFALTLNPEKFEGAGCITFAAALMKKAGVFTEVFKKSNRSLWASHYRFGGNDLEIPENTVVPRISWREDESKRVSINEFFSANWNAGLKGVNLKLIDPELLVWGYKNLSPELVSRPRKVIQVPQECGRGDPCTPKHIPVNDSYDKQALQVSQAARSWKRKMLNKGYKVRQLFLQNEPFLIFDKR